MLPVFFLIGVAISAIAHWFIVRFGAAIILSAVLGAVILQVMDFIKMGHLDPFYETVFLMSLAIYAAVSVIVGMVVRGVKAKLEQ